MRPLIQAIASPKTPEALAEKCRPEPGLALLRSSLFGSPHARYSFLAARPFLLFRSFGMRCELLSPHGSRVELGDPWRVLSGLMSRYELLDDPDLPFPLGGCFGFWGYDLNRFTEPKLALRSENASALPDAQVGFYGSLIAFDHWLDKTWIISTGLSEDGSRNEERARREADWWLDCLLDNSPGPERESSAAPSAPREFGTFPTPAHPVTSSADGFDSSWPHGPALSLSDSVFSNFSRTAFVERVERARSWIRRGDIYQVNLSQRLTAPLNVPGWEFFQKLNAVSPAPFSAFLDLGEFQLASSSPELFLRLSGAQVQTCPIKGTRARSGDPCRDAQLAYELQTSPKETAELVMITDLLRNDLGKCCEFGTVQTPDLLRLERFPHVQHLVSTVEGRLRAGICHLDAFASCFPGGSITGAPKFRAMEIIDELEATKRGPYTGALGYLGFNRESQLSIIIRTAICQRSAVHFSVGAGIVADSDADAEYEETLVKARGFFNALRLDLPSAEAARSGLELSSPAPATPPGHSG